MELFVKYVGVQGVLALFLVAGYIVAPFFEVVLPEGYTEIAVLVLGFYFGKNGVGIIQTVKGIR